MSRVTPERPDRITTASAPDLHDLGVRPTRRRTDQVRDPLRSTTEYGTVEDCFRLGLGVWQRTREALREVLVEAADLSGRAGQV